MKKSLSLLFPCFGIEYTGKEDSILYEFGIDIDGYFKRGGKFLKVDPSVIKKSKDEFYSQVEIFLYSAAVSDLLKSKGIEPEYIAYYSMGIYSALYYSGSIDFDAALFLIKNVYELSDDFIKRSGVFYNMAYIIGLSMLDISKLIDKNSLKVEIINQNNEHSFVLSGVSSDVSLLLEAAKEEGALKVNFIPAVLPFHSSFMIGGIDCYKKMLKEVKVLDSEIPFVSCFDQKIFSKSFDIKNEILFNIINKISWFNTFKKLLSLKQTLFIEAGPGDALTKVARFIEGDFVVYPLSKLNSFLNQS